jgi:hypothetical protein
VRGALVDALQTVAGAEIARSTQSATRSTLGSVERERHEHIVVRSGGRIAGWEILDERVEASAADERTVVVRLRVDVCLNPREERALVVALGDPEWLIEPGLDQLRLALAEELGRQPGLSPVEGSPGTVYHDVAISFAHSLEREKVDNRPQAAILSQFGAGESLAAEALAFDLVTVTATVIATRFVDKETVSETAVRRARLPAGAPSGSAMRDLALEAYLLAGRAAVKRLAAGELAY